MSQAQEQFPMPALTALGQEFERLATAPRPVRSRLPVIAPWKVALPAIVAALALFMLTTSPGQALAREIGELFGLTTEQRIIVNGDAGTGPTLVPAGTNILEDARPASECPEAAAAYLAIGVHVDLFLGPCPDPADLPGAVPVGGEPPRSSGSHGADETRRERFLHSIGAPTDRP